MAMVALKAPSIEVVVLDINEGMHGCLARYHSSSLL
jgi:hypothetical protein